jgi:hypothetical protein
MITALAVRPYPGGHFALARPLALPRRSLSAAATPPVPLAPADGARGNDTKTPLCPAPDSPPAPSGRSMRIAPIDLGVGR